MGKNLSRLQLADQEREVTPRVPYLLNLRCGNAYPERGMLVLDLTVNKEGKIDEARIVSKDPLRPRPQKRGPRWHYKPAKVENQQSHRRSAHYSESLSDTFYSDFQSGTRPRKLFLYHFKVWAG